MRNSAIAMEVTPRALARQRARRIVYICLQALLVVAAYAGGIALALALMIPGSRALPIYPANAILLALLLLTPRRSWWLWLLASAIPLVGLLLLFDETGWRLGLDLLQDALLVLPIAVGLRRYAPEAISFATFRGVVAFLVATISTALLVPMLTTAVFVAAGATLGFWYIWWQVAFANLLAYLTILPLMLMTAQYGFAWLRESGRARVVEAATLAAVVLLFAYAFFVVLPPGPNSNTYFRIGVLPLLLWAAVRFGPGGFSAAITVLALVAIRSTALGLGPFGDAPAPLNVLNLQTELLTFAAPLLLLAALIEERRSAEAALRRLNAELEERVAGRTAQLERTNEQLAVARDEAEAANRAKSDFLATMSHELRTPMNAVIGMTTLLLGSPLTATQRDDLETIKRSGNMLLTLINDVLDYSKIDANKLTLEYHTFAVRACVEEALDLAAPLADAKQLALLYDPDPALPDEFVGDAARLRQILVNLLSNAVRFTERGEIAVGLTGARQPAADANAPIWDLTITVRDTGVGISAKQLARIFEPFTQAGATRGQGGTGLGLSISRRLAGLMGGRIRVTSTPGSGSTFSVELPALATAAPPTRFLARHQPVLEGKPVLVLAGHAGIGQTLQGQLSAWRMAATVAGSGSAALAWLNDGHPVDALVLVPDLAIGSPKTLVEQLRAAAGKPALPAVLGTAVSHRALMLDATKPAYTIVLQLPLRPSALYDALFAALGGDTAGALPRAPVFDATMGLRWPLRILLAEDNGTNQQVALRLLAKLGYQAQVAANGVDVLEALRQQDFDLVLMDIQMPEMSGTEAAHYIRSLWPPERQPRIAAMTAYASEENRAWLLSTGMDDYIRKPVRIEDLVRVLNATAHAPRGQPADPTSAAGDTGATLDAGMFNTFLATVGSDDPAEDAAFVEGYLADMAAQIRALGEALSGGDTVRLSRIAHTLEGLSLQLGARDLAILSRRVNVAASEDMQVVDALRRSAEAAFDDVRRAVHQHSSRNTEPGS